MFLESFKDSGRGLVPIHPYFGAQIKRDLPLRFTCYGFYLDTTYY